MTFAKDLRAAIEETLFAYADKKALGSDAYCNSNIYHPMADGKYLQTLAVLKQSKLISTKQLVARSEIACVRLESSALECFENGWGWGLGFLWRNLPTSEPFLITSAIVYRGLLDCHNQGLLTDVSKKLLRNGRIGLKAWLRELALPVDESTICLPAYSPGIREPIYNAAAYSMGTLSLVKDAEGNTPAGTAEVQGLEWIRSHRIEGIGWQYSPKSPIVDLLHQCYILNALADAFGVQSIESASVEMLGQFAGSCCFADAMRLVSVDDQPDIVRDIAWVRPIGRNHIEVLPKPARLWSLGELLVLITRLGFDGERSDAWVRQGRRVAESILLRLTTRSDAETQFPRQVMHAVHGLACYLALLRKIAQKNRETGKMAS